MFATKYKLKEHVMRHEGIKNFVCPICGLRKTTGHELRVHLFHHSNNTQFPCEICSTVFTRMANMRRHMKVVHCGVKAYSCKYCDQVNDSYLFFQFSQFFPAQFLLTVNFLVIREG